MIHLSVKAILTEQISVTDSERAYWNAKADKSASLAVTLIAASWSNNVQTVSATGVTTSNNVVIAPAPASQDDYVAAGIKCTAQGAGTLTFSCSAVPDSGLTVNVLIVG